VVIQTGLLLVSIDAPYSSSHTHLISDCFATYPTNTFQDDTLLSKPCTAYDWLDFHDRVSSKVYSGQEWELTPYLSQSILAFHHLFASSTSNAHASNQEGPRYNHDNTDEEIHPFAGPRADFAAFEAIKHNRATLNNLQSSLSISLTQAFRSPETIAVDLLPHLNRMLNPAVKPVVVGGSNEQRGVASVRRESERDMVKRAVGVMSGVGVIFERGRLEGENSFRNAEWVYRMEP
jgi:chromosome transmission fidelity protein 18